MYNDLQLRMDESPEYGLKRIALALLGEAQLELQNMEVPDASIHKIRTCFKKFRALLWLVRQDLDEEQYRYAHLAIRNAGRKIAELRDARILIDTVEDLWEDYYDFLAEEVFMGIRTRLKVRYQNLLTEVLEHEPTLDEVLISVNELIGPVRRWPLFQTNFETCFEGVRTVYKEGRKLMNIAWKDPAPEQLHEWRKQVKYLYYQMGFLNQIWPEMISVYENCLGELQGLLGKDHDLAVLSESFNAGPNRYHDEKRRHILQHLIMRERRALQEKAWPLGYQLYHEQPALFGQRLLSYYEARRMELE